MIILALDVDGTLIRNVIEPVPRPFLGVFLEALPMITERVCIYSAADPSYVERAFLHLVGKKRAPQTLLTYPRVRWERAGHKRMRRASELFSGNPADVVLVDDLEQFIHPSERSQWEPIAPFVDDPGDAELLRILRRLFQRNLTKL